jgi:hypothetical protein
VQEAKAMAANPDSVASVDPGERLSGLELRGLISPAALPAYRSLMESIYAPRLAAIGFDPAFGAYASDDPDRQKLRQQLVGLVAFDAHDPSLRTKLKAAAEKYLAGDEKALDPAFRGSALTVLAEDGNLATAKMLVEKALSTEDPDVRADQLGAAAASGTTEVADYLLGLNDPRLRTYDRIRVLYGLAETVPTRDYTADWVLKHFDELLASGGGIFMTGRIPGALAYQCGIDQANRIQSVLGPRLEKAQIGTLTFQRTVEKIRDCGILKQAKGAEIDAAIAAK